MSKARAGERRRILLITRNLPPMRGGMERLNLHMAIELAKEFDVAVIGPRGCREFLEANIAVCEAAPPKPLWHFFVSVAYASVREAFRWRPDIVLGGSGLVAPFVWAAAKFARARMVVYVHGLDLIASHPIFRWFWRPFIRRANLCIANSANTAALARSIGVDNNRVVVVHPGVTVPAPEANPNDFRKRFNLGNRPLLLSIGRLIARKGLLEFVENALPRIVAQVPAVCLVVIGDEAPEMLQGSSAGLGERIRRRSKILGVDGNIRFIGPQDDNTLSMAYRAADVHVFPVIDLPGDVEGFGMVAVEAAVQGLPTVAFAVGGIPDAVANGISGYLVPAGDYGQMASVLIDLLRGRFVATLRDSAHVFGKQFEWENIGEQLRNVNRKELAKR